MPAVLNTVSGHWESYEVTEIDPEVQDFITKCQNLMYTLGRHQESVEKLQRHTAI